MTALRDGLLRCGFALLAYALVGCVPTSRSPAPASSVASGPTIVCGLDQPICGKATVVVLRAVGSYGPVPTHVWINSGALPPLVEMLFDPAANFPAPVMPGGSFLGSAEVAFSGTAAHAGMNLFLLGSDVAPQMVGYAVPRTGWCSGVCP